jgi:hypothetical protein
MTLTITIGGKEIRLATVTYDDETGLYETYIGLPVTAHQLGRIDASREHAVRKAEEFLTEKLRRLARILGRDPVHQLRRRWRRRLIVLAHQSGTTSLEQHRH